MTTLESKDESPQAGFSVCNELLGKPAGWRVRAKNSPWFYRNGSEMPTCFDGWDKIEPLYSYGDSDFLFAARKLQILREMENVLRQIAALPRKTREQRLASACVHFLDALDSKPNA